MCKAWVQQRNAIHSPQLSSYIAMVVQGVYANEKALGAASGACQLRLLFCVTIGWCEVVAFVAWGPSKR